MIPKETRSQLTRLHLNVDIQSRLSAKRSEFMFIWSPLRRTVKLNTLDDAFISSTSHTEAFVANTRVYKSHMDNLHVSDYTCAPFISRPTKPTLEAT